MAVSIEAGGLVKMTADEDKIEHSMTIHKLRWIGAITASHGLIVQDLDGKDILIAIASSTNYLETQDFVPPLIVNGVHITAMESGSLYVYG